MRETATAGTQREVPDHDYIIECMNINIQTNLTKREGQHTLVVTENRTDDQWYTTRSTWS